MLKKTGILILLLLFCCNIAAVEIDPGRVEDKILYFEYHNYRINITSMPSGARIYIDDEYIGETPVTYYVDGKVSKLHHFSFQAQPQVKNDFHYPQTFNVEIYKVIPRHIHFDMLHTHK